MASAGEIRMTLDNEEKYQVCELFDDLFSKKMLPLHTQNRKDIHALNNSVETVANEIHLYFAEERGAKAEQKRNAEKRDKSIALGNWLTAIVGIVVTIIFGILMYIVANRSHDSSRILSSDPTISQYQEP